MPDGFLSRLSTWQAAIGAARLTDLRRDVAPRRAIAARYTELLAGAGRATAIEPPESTHAFLPYPLRVRDRDRFVPAGFDLGNWLVSPIYPVVHGLHQWGFIAGSASVAEQVCREIVDLSMEPRQSDPAVERTIRFLAATPRAHLLISPGDRAAATTSSGMAEKPHEHGDATGPAVRRP